MLKLLYLLLSIEVRRVVVVVGLAGLDSTDLQARIQFTRLPARQSGRWWWYLAASVSFSLAIVEINLHIPRGSQADCCVQPTS